MHPRSSFWRWFGWALLIGTLAVAVAAAISVGLLFSHLPPDLLITIDGEQIELGGLEAGHAWLAFGAIVLAVTIVVIVVPLTLLFGVGLPLLMVLLGVVAALACAAIGVAIVGSPVILLGLLVWWAARPKKHAAAPAAPAAPPPVPVIGQHTDKSTPFA